MEVTHIRGQLEDFKEQATQLAAQAFPHDDPGPQLADSLIARLCEEAGEVAQAVRRHTRKRWGHEGEEPGSSQAVAEEIGDLLFVTVRLAALCGVNLDQAQEAVLTKFRQRLAVSGPKRLR